MNVFIPIAVVILNLTTTAVGYVLGGMTGAVIGFLIPGVAVPLGYLLLHILARGLSRHLEAEDLLRLLWDLPRWIARMLFSAIRNAVEALQRKSRQS